MNRMRCQVGSDHDLAELKITLESGENPSAGTFTSMTEAILLAQIMDLLYPNLNRLDIHGDMEYVGSRGRTSSKYSLGIMRTRQ
jgi:hypothetical protein